MNDTEQSLREFFHKAYFPDGSTAAAKTNFLKRKLICTPYEGNHGMVAGWVICVDGSPPKGTLLVMKDRMTAVFVSAAGSTVKSVKGERQLQTIKSFCDEHLDGVEKPLVLGE